MSRLDSNSFGIIAQLNAGEVVPGCCVCCRAPACLPICSIFPCCDDADYINLKREASKYILVRENSIGELFLFACLLLSIVFIDHLASVELNSYFRLFLNESSCIGQKNGMNLKLC